MKQLSFIVIALFLIAVSSESWRFNLRSDTFCTGKPPGFYCSSCKELVLCPFGSSLNCAKYDVNTPFCKEGINPGNATCHYKDSCTGSSNADPIESCNKLGLFPDALSCNVYQVCSEIQESAVQFGCPPKTQFDPIRGVCATPSKTANNCHTFSATEVNGLCKGKPLATVVHPSRPDVYCTCDGNYKLQTCKENQIYNAKKRRCEIKCSKEGFFADPENKGLFITCYKLNDKWMHVVHSCGDDSEYDSEKLKHCRRIRMEPTTVSSTIVTTEPTQSSIATTDSSEGTSESSSQGSTSSSEIPSSTSG